MGNDRQLHKCHNMPAKVSWCTQQGSGLETGSLEQRTCRTSLRGLERHGCPGLLLWSPVFPGAHAASLPCALQLSGERSRTQREVGSME